MFGLSNLTEKRQQRMESQRAQHAFDDVRAMPLDMQQDIARQVLRECTETMGMLDNLARNGKDQDEFYLLHIAELEERIRRRESVDSIALDRQPTPLILARAILLATSGLRKGSELNRLAETFMRWAKTILPDFGRFEAQLLH